MFPEDENEPNDYRAQIMHGDFLVHKDIVQKHAVQMRLPKSADYTETYAGFNEITVLPNTGQIREVLGITSLDFKLEGDRNSFNVYFEDTRVERFKYNYSNTHFHIKGKEDSFDQFWEYDEVFEGENRNKAINKAYKSWDMENVSFIKFKSMISCKQNKTKVLDRWIRNKIKSTGGNNGIN